MASESIAHSAFRPHGPLTQSRTRGIIVKYLIVTFTTTYCFCPLGLDLRRSKHFIFRYELLYNLVYTIQTVATKDKPVHISYILILIHSKQFKLSRSTILQGLSSCTCRFKMFMIRFKHLKNTLTNTASSKTRRGGRMQPCWILSMKLLVTWQGA